MPSYLFFFWMDTESAISTIEGVTKLINSITNKYRRAE